MIEFRSLCDLHFRMEQLWKPQYPLKITSPDTIEKKLTQRFDAAFKLQL